MQDFAQRKLVHEGLGVQEQELVLLVPQGNAVGNPRNERG